MTDDVEIDDVEMVRKALATIPRERLVEQASPNTETHTMIRTYDHAMADEALDRIAVRLAAAESDLVRERPITANYVVVMRERDDLRARLATVERERDGSALLKDLAEVALRKAEAEVERLREALVETTQALVYIHSDLKNPMMDGSNITRAQERTEEAKNLGRRGLVGLPVTVCPRCGGLVPPEEQAHKHSLCENHTTPTEEEA